MVVMYLVVMYLNMDKFECSVLMIRGICCIIKGWRFGCSVGIMVWMIDMVLIIFWLKVFFGFFVFVGRELVKVFIKGFFINVCRFGMWVRRLGLKLWESNFSVFLVLWWVMWVVLVFCVNFVVLMWLMWFFFFCIDRMIFVLCVWMGNLGVLVILI